MDSVYKKLQDNFCAIPRCYITFCMNAVKELKDGEDINSLENFIEDLANFDKSKEDAIRTFVESCSNENVIDDLNDTLVNHLNFLKYQLYELDNAGFNPDSFEGETRL